MEKWQKDHIVNNFTSLCKSTTCSKEFISHLINLQIICQADLSKLNTEESFSSSYELYQIAITRKDGFEAIFYALFSTHQLGAFKIFLDGFTANDIKYPLQHCRIDLCEAIKKPGKLGFIARQEIFKMPVLYQGRCATLNQLCSTMPPEELDKMTMNANDDDLIEVYIRNGSYPLVKHTAVEPISFYQSRTLTRSRKLDPKVFLLDTNVIFVFQGIHRDQLITLVGSAQFRTDTSRKQLHEYKKLTVRHIQLIKDEDYSKLCNKTKENIHLIRYCNDEYIWEHSKGGTSVLKNYVVESCEVVSEDEILQLISLGRTSVSLCISNLGGMGKSQFLKNLASKLSCIDTCVICCAFSELCSWLRHRFGVSSTNLNVLEIQNLFAKKLSNCKLGEKVAFHKISNKNTRMVLLLHGFDGLPNSELEYGVDVLKFLRASFQKAHIVITTRPHLQEVVENAIGTLCCSLLPLGIQKQIQLLVDYWVSVLKLVKTPQMESYALSFIKSTQPPETRHKSEVEGTPYNCHLLAQAYENEIKMAFSEECTAVRPEIKPLSEFDSYRKIIKTNLESSRQQRSLCGKFPLIFRNFNEQNVEAVLIYLAIKKLYPNELCDNIKLVHQKPRHMEEILKLGMFRSYTQNNNENFLHPNEAEFWLAKFLVYVASDRDKEICLKVNKPAAIKLLITEALSLSYTEVKFLEHCFSLKGNNIVKPTFKNPTLTIRMNAHINELQLSGVQACPNKNVFSHIAKMRHFGDILAACMIQGCDKLFNFFTNAEYFQKLKFSNSLTLLYFEPIMLATKYVTGDRLVSYYETFAHLGRKNNSGSVNTKVVTTLHLAIVRGHYALVHLFLRQLSTKVLDKMLLLHFCLRGTANINDDKKLNDIKDAVDLIIEKAPDALVERLHDDNSTPLLQEQVHISLLKHVLDKSASLKAMHLHLINDKTFLYETVLHKAINSHNLDYQLVDYKALLKFASDNRFAHFGAPNCVGKTPLHLAVEKYEVDEEFFQLFEDMSVDLNCIDKNGENIAFYAVRHGRSLKCLKLISEHEVNFEAINEKGETLLHLATEYGTFELFEFLLDLIDSLIQSYDIHGNNALHIAMRRPLPDSDKFQERLITKGINLRQVNNLGRVPIVEGFRVSNGVMSIEVVKLMEQHGLKLKNLASECINAMLLNSNFSVSECQEQFSHMLNYMINNGGDFYFEHGVPIWTCRPLQQCMQKLFCKSLSAEEVICNFLNLNKKESLYNWEKVKTSLCKLCIFLLEKKMLSEFCSIRQCLRACSASTIRFKTSPDEIIKHLQNRHGPLIVHTSDVDVCISKIMDTVGGHTIIHENCINGTVCTTGDILIVKVGENENLLASEHSCFKKTKFVIFVTTLPYSETPRLNQARSIRDNIRWYHLTLQYQAKLAQKKYLHKSYHADSVTYESLSEMALVELVKKPSMSCNVIRELIEIKLKPKFNKAQINIGVIKLAIAQAFPDLADQSYLANCDLNLETIETTNDLIKIEEDSDEKRYEFRSKLDCFFIVGAALATHAIKDMCIEENLNKKLSIIDEQIFYIFDSSGSKVKFSKFSFRFPIMVYSYFQQHQNIKDSVFDKACGNKFIYACVVDNMLNIISQIISTKESDLKFDVEIAIAVIKFGSLQMIKRMIEHCIDINSLEFGREKLGKDFTLIHLAVQRGDYSVVDYLLHHLNCCKNNMFLKNDAMRHLFNHCVSHTAHFSKEEIIERQQIISLLRFKFGGHLEYNDYNFKHVFGITEKIHLELIKFLINLKADCFFADLDSGCNVVHKAALYMTPKQYLELTRFLIDVGKGELFKKRNKSSESAIRWAILNLPKTQEDKELCMVLEIINKKAGIDYSLPNESHISILECAERAHAEGKRCISVINTIRSLLGDKLPIPRKASISTSM